MSGLIRQKLHTARRAIAVLAFSLTIPFCEGRAMALPSGGRPGKEAPVQKFEDPNPMFASMRAAMGGMIVNLLQKKRFVELGGMQASHEKRAYSGKPEPLKFAASELSREMGILVEAGGFKREDRFRAAIASVHVSLPHLSRVRSSSKTLVRGYVGSIRKLGGDGLAGTVEQWLKNGKGDVVTFYKRLSACKGTGR